MRQVAVMLLLSVATTAQAQVTAKGLALDLNADKGVEVEDGDRVAKWTNQVPTFAARDFVITNGPSCVLILKTAFGRQVGC